MNDPTSASVGQRGMAPVRTQVCVSASLWVSTCTVMPSSRPELLVASPWSVGPEASFVGADLCDSAAGG